MKKEWIIIIAIVVVGIIAFAGFNLFTNNNNTDDNGSQYQATRILAENQNSQNGNNQNQTVENKPVETELYSFSTPIKSSSENRLTNIKITCSRINETVVKAHKEFSFCDVVGQPNSKDGYKPADAFGENGEIIQAIGGGNCQVSTTIYNAALGVNGLKITERHEHSRDVAYIEDGKDATVAYDYLDLKFKNTNDYDIKLYSFVKDDKVTVEIFKVS